MARFCDNIVLVGVGLPITGQSAGSCRSLIVEIALLCEFDLKKSDRATYDPRRRGCRSEAGGWIALPLDRVCRQRFLTCSAACDATRRMLPRLHVSRRERGISDRKQHDTGNIAGFLTLDRSPP